MIILDPDPGKTFRIRPDPDQDPQPCQNGFHSRGWLHGLLRRTKKSQISGVGGEGWGWAIDLIITSQP